MRLLFTIFALWLAALPLSAQPRFGKPHTAAELVADVASVQPGADFWVALRLKMDPHWHTYWINPGSNGLPTTIEWSELPDGVTIGEIHWPTPKTFEMSGIINYVYEDEVFLMMPVSVADDVQPGQTFTLKARADWLECDDKMCVPGGADLTLELPVSAEAPEPTAWATALQQTRDDRWPRSLPESWQASASIADETVTLTLTPQGDATQHNPGALTFFSANSFISSDAVQGINRQADGVIALTLTKSEFFAGGAESLPGVIRSSNGWLPGGEPIGLSIDPKLGEKAPPPSPPSGGEKGPASSNSAANGASEGEHSFATLLFFAFVGGFILNLMPCVFPVIGLKIMGFVKQAGESRGKVIAHGLVYTAGVLISFWAIGLLFEPVHQTFVKTGDTVGGWGSWLTPNFVLFLIILVFVFSLSLSGVFEIGGSLTGVGGRFSGQAGYAGSFTSGLFAVAVGAPCAAPFLSIVIGALVKSPLLTREVLLAFMGLGLAAPYLLLSIFPALTKKLPKPGAWMETFKEGMAFLLYATVAALVWVIADQVEPYTLLAILIALVLAALGCWIFGRWGAPHRSNTSRRVATLFFALLIILPAINAWSMISQDKERQELIAQAQETGAQLDFLVWEEWSPEAVQTLLAEGRPVYIDFTARWCATCQVNKRVYNDPSLIKLFQERNVATLKADYTKFDPRITQTLSAFGRNAVPFNVLYIPGEPNPITLPELLTVSNVEAALREIGQG